MKIRISESFGNNREESGERKQAKDEASINIAYGKTPAAPGKVRTL